MCEPDWIARRLMHAYRYFRSDAPQPPMPRRCIWGEQGPVPRARSGGDEGMFAPMPPIWCASNLRRRAAWARCLAPTGSLERTERATPSGTASRPIGEARTPGGPEHLFARLRWQAKRPDYPPCHLSPSCIRRRRVRHSRRLRSPQATAPRPLPAACPCDRAQGTAFAPFPAGGHRGPCLRGRRRSG